MLTNNYLQPKERLSHPEDIKNHEFFHGIDWDKLAKKEIPPPYSLDLEQIDDLSFFDPVTFLLRMVSNGLSVLYGKAGE